MFATPRHPERKLMLDDDDDTTNWIHLPIHACQNPSSNMMLQGDRTALSGLDFDANLTTKLTNYSDRYDENRDLILLAIYGKSFHLATNNVRRA